MALVFKNREGPRVWLIESTEYIIDKVQQLKTTQEKVNQVPITKNDKGINEKIVQQRHLNANNIMDNRWICDEHVSMKVLTVELLNLLTYLILFVPGGT